MPNALRRTLFIILAALALTKVTLFLTRRQNRKSNPDAYYSLRDQILHLRRDQIGLPAPQHDTDPWAVLMDWGVTHGTATVVAVSDGTASIYLSSGGGSLRGGQSHESLRQAALRAVSISAEFQPEMLPFAAYPLPPRAEFIFSVLTDSTVFYAATP